MMFNRKVNGSLCKCLCAISFPNFVRQKMKMKYCYIIILHIYLTCNSTHFNQGGRISTKAVHAKYTLLYQINTNNNSFIVMCSFCIVVAHLISAFHPVIDYLVNYKTFNFLVLTAY